MFSAVITNFNTCALTQRCVASILKFEADRIDKVIVVDDASTDPKPRFADYRVEIVLNERNVGFNACVNIGMKRARSPFVLLLDSDAYLLGPLIAACEKELLSTKDLGIIGFYLVDENGRPTGASSPFPTVAGLVLGQRIGGFIEARISKSQALHACAVALRKAAFEEVEGFDERFDWLDGDIDFAMRLHASGWKALVRNDIRVYHTGGGAPQATSKRVFRFHQNRLALLRKHGNITWPRLVKCLLLARHGIEISILLAVMSFRFGNERIKDKLSGRVALMRTVLRDYK
jgi:GT2 family glycosyltransferase